MVIDQDSTISNNDADLQGGGLANIDSAATIEGSTFQENRATGGVSGVESAGGGVYNLVGEVHIISSTIHSNVAATLETMDELGRGGGIANSGGMIEIKATDIRSNFADNGCGGILNEEGSTLTMEGGALAQNESEAGGGGVHCPRWPPAQHRRRRGSAAVPGTGDPPLSRDRGSGGGGVGDHPIGEHVL